MLAKRFILAGFILGVYCLTALADEEDELHDREPKEYIPEVWHAIETIPEGSTGWIPRDPLDSLGKAQTKRRRLRKRKRRPPIVTYLDQSAESVAPVLAQEPSKSQDTWKEMQEESGRPNVRRKVTPAYSPIAAEPEGDQNRRKSQGPNIKDILKQSGGLSLSEILQQKNVTLAELLMGKEEAIQALTERTKYKRIPPSIGLHKEGMSRRYETITESQDAISSREREQAQKKRLALLQSQNFPEDTRQEAAAEPTTEARVETSTTSEPSTTKTPDGNKVKTGLPLTSAQLMKIVTKTKAAARPLPTPPPEEEENYPNVNGTLFKPLKIYVKENVKHTENQPGEKQQDGPLRMSIDLKTVDFAPKLEPSSAREEILQILTDPVGRAGLARILEARNMSVQELIEQRERGSSQLHLADIFHNNTREPEPSDEAFEGKINSEVFSSFPVFARQPKSLPSPTTEQPVPAISFKIQANSSTNATHPWQRLYPNLFSGPNQEQQPKYLVPQRIEEALDILTEEAVQRLDDVDQTVYSSISTQQLNIDENPWQMLKISTGVRSAIVASLVIVLLSIVVFVSILMVFRWRQSRKKCLDYGDSLKPALISIKRHNIKTFVAGKKNVNYYKRHLQSMSDDSWETESKRRI